MFITSFSPFQSWKQASAKSQSSAESFNFNAEMGNLTKRLELAKISASAGQSEGLLGWNQKNHTSRSSDML